jgi:hypothetical protein
MGATQDHVCCSWLCRALHDQWVRDLKLQLVIVFPCKRLGRFPTNDQWVRDLKLQLVIVFPCKRYCRDRVAGHCKSPHRRQHISWLAWVMLLSQAYRFVLPSGFWAPFARSSTFRTYVYLPPHHFFFTISRSALSPCRDLMQHCNDTRLISRFIRAPMHPGLCLGFRSF